MGTLTQTETETSPAPDAPEVETEAPAPVAAAAPVAEPEVEAPDAPPMTDGTGTPFMRWRMPVAVLEGVRTGDRRLIDRDVLTWRDLPRSLMATTTTTEGHDGAELVGRIDAATRVDASAMVDSRTGEPYGEGAFAIQLEGVFTNEDQARRVADLIKGGFLQGVSVDMSDVDFTLDLVDADGNPVDTEADDFDDSGVMLQQTITAGRIMGATVLPFEAFEAAFIELVDDDGNAGPATTPGRPTPKQQAAAVRASAPVYQPRACAPCESGAIVAAAAPVLPPRAWFVDPCLTEPTPITVTDAGQVFGHLALWDTCHIGHSGQCVTPPRSATNYALFNRKPIPTADGDPVQIGPLTVGTGHADTKPGTGMFAAISHYDNTGHVAADVTAGEDELGIWVAGALRPDATPEQVRVLRASSISGDWRDWGGNLELGAVLAVNTPGFPVLRQVVASGRPMALIAVGPAPSTTPAELAEIRALLPDLQAAAERERRARDLTATRAQATRGRMRALSAAAQRDRMGSMG